MDKNIRTINTYLKGVSREEGIYLEKLRGIIKEAAPESTETISYGMPTFDYHGHLIAFAAFKDHYSLFPMNGSYIEEHTEELREYDSTKGSLHLSKDKPLPAALVRKIVKDRMKENETLLKKKNREKNKKAK
jgi:uncharacterized protein YdhG (YjbR/CyaY superfamily)